VYIITSMHLGGAGEETLRKTSPAKVQDVRIEDGIYATASLQSGAPLKPDMTTLRLNSRSHAI
jgi:hypothetical protein